MPCLFCPKQNYIMELPYVPEGTHFSIFLAFDRSQKCLDERHIVPLVVYVHSVGMLEKIWVVAGCCQDLNNTASTSSSVFWIVGLQPFNDGFQSIPVLLLCFWLLSVVLSLIIILLMPIMNSKVSTSNGYMIWCIKSKGRMLTSSWHCILYPSTLITDIFYALLDSYWYAESTCSM